jgi:biopolymer transport protein ExbD
MASVQSAGSSRRRRRGGITGINVTPFVDISLVLLIIMMVSSTYIVSQSLKVELPKTATSDQAVPRTYVVTLSQDGQLLFNDEATTLDKLRDKLKQARTTEDVSLVITADRRTEHGKVVEVIDTAKLANVTKFAINVERTK